MADRSGVNKLMRVAQSTGGSPYDEDAYMRMPVPRSGRNALMGGGGRPGDEDLKAMAGAGRRPSPNDWLNDRLYGRLRAPFLADYITGDESAGFGEDYDYKVPSRYTSGGMGEGVTSNPRRFEGSDMDMMMMYGPEDQVVMDHMGRPIPLNDPRHPRNQQNMGVLQSYPQQRR